MICGPTAKHVASFTHEMPFRVVALGGGVCGVQVVPPFVVVKIAEPGPTDGTPMAVQFSESEQETSVKLEIDAEKDSVVQLAPPFDVAMMLGPEAPKSLTA
jgi:hypothetical protein